MKKYLKLILALSIMVVFSCKKDESKSSEPEKLINRLDLKMQLPGQGSQEVYLIPQGNGTYKAAWGGNMTFGTIPHQIVNVQNGHPVGSVEILDLNSEYLEIMTAGPYFTVIRPTFVGDPEVTREEFKKFKTAYNNYIEQKRNESGALVQPYLPDLDISNSGSGEIIIKGMIVHSTASPSKMSIVSSSFIPPSAIIPFYELLPEYVVGNIRYDIAGNNNGEISEVTAVNINTNESVPIYGFSGYYSITGGTTTVTNLKIWTSATAFITYTGTL